MIGYVFRRFAWLLVVGAGAAIVYAIGGEEAVRWWMIAT